MARSNGVDDMSFSELTALEARIGKLKAEKQGAERAELKARLTTMAKEAGFDIHDLFGKGGKGRTVAAKYRDKAGNTWTGRGRPPRWLTAALKTKGVKRDDFLIK